MPSREARLEKGTFLFSWDFELAWGYHDLNHLPAQLHHFDTRNYISKLIECLEKNGVPSTWATVGHLFLEECSPVNDVLHPDVPHLTRNWYHRDPGTDVECDPLWYAPDIVEELINCSPKQEIGCHTFSHIPIDADSDIFRSEIQKCIDIAPDGIRLRSYVAPRHSEVPAEILKELGFECYRIPSTKFGITRALDFYLGTHGPPTGLPVRDKHGLWRIPTSTFFFYNPFHSFQKRMPQFKRRWFRQGLENAVANKEIFHVWAHPCNFLGNKDAIDQFRWLMKLVRNMAKKGKIQMMTMDELVSHLQE